MNNQQPEISNFNADISNLSPKWKARFAFFDEHGGPPTPAYWSAIKALPFG